MPEVQQPGDVEQVLGGGGEAGALARSIDWSTTALGPVAGWSQALRSAAALVLHNHSGMLLWWGPRFAQIYNDAYRPVLGDKHPRAMGQPFSECWAEVFHIVGPMAERPYRGGPASTSDDLELLINRKVHREETHFRVAYSPVPDETVRPTGIGGVLATVTETTEQVYGERQLRTLRELGVRGAADSQTAEQACVAAAATLQQDPWDVPFVLLYLFDTDGGHPRLVASAGFGSPPSALAAGDWRWPLADAARDKRILIVDDLAACPVVLPRSPWSEAPREAIVLPLGSPDQPNAYGMLVCGVSPHRVLDTGYRTFFELAAGQVVTALRNAGALEAERKRALALAEIDRAKTAFFSNVSHEFRTPLTLMLGPQQDALDSPAGVLGGEDLRSVHRNTQRLLKLVNSLLEFSRIESGRAKASYEPTDLQALTRDLASAFRSAVEHGGLRFEVDCEPLPEPVYVDRDMWERIVLNLISNAFKFTLEGGITVAQRVDGRNVVLSVTDTGVGIPDAELPRVFERFHRVEAMRARTHEGSGIGLALVHDIVRLHGGKVEVASHVGQGTSFTVTLPLGSGHLPADHVRAESSPLDTSRLIAQPFVNEAMRWLPGRGQAAPAAETSAPAPAVVGARVLLADDNADMRDYVARLLRQKWTVDVARDGAEALERARQERPDLILADVMMPNLDGFGLLRAVRADPLLANVPVIMLSARAGEEARIGGLQAGADDYLVKPFSAKDLLARVAVHLENAAARRAGDAERTRLRSLLGQLPAIVNFLRGPELVVEFAHPLTVARLGGRELLGKPLLEAVPEFSEQDYPRLLRMVIETGELIEGREHLVRIRDASGALHDTYWNFVYLPVRDDAGRVEGVMTFDLEVTEQVAARSKIEEQTAALALANRAAQRAREVAEAASRAKDEFLAMLGHELRNPLSPIVTSLRLMRLRGADSREQSLIERQIGHLVRLVDDLLDVSRITRGKVELRKTRTELAPVVLRGLEMASTILEQRRQKVDLQVAPEGLELDVDPDRLAQVAANLLTNASKYSEPGTVVRVTATRVNERVRLSVRDQGIGIEPAMLSRIFEVFYQQPQSLDRSKGGLGLGLAIVHSLVELHGGSVSASSAGVGKGSEFIVELPLASGTAPLEGLPTWKVPAIAMPAATPSRKRILVVDDNLDAAESLGDFLEYLGNEVELAQDGPEALEIAARFHPDLCLIDIGLPVMDGYELARRLRESQHLAPNARLIAVTGYGRPADREQSQKAGFDDHMVKPVNPDLLTSAVTN